MIYKDERLPRAYPYIYPIVFHQKERVLEAMQYTLGKGRRTFYFDTGVRPGIPLNERHIKDAKPVPLMTGQVWRNGTMQIPFDCEDVPENVSFAFARDDPNSYLGCGYIVREIHNSSLGSKYAYFKNGIQL